MPSNISRDSRGLPRPEILVDPPEVLGTYLGVCVLGLVFQGIIQGACLLCGCIRALDRELFVCRLGWKLGLRRLGWKLGFRELGFLQRWLRRAFVGGSLEN